jgi:hypothetical protein
MIAGRQELRFPAEPCEAIGIVGDGAAGKHPSGKNRSPRLPSRAVDWVVPMRSMKAHREGHDEGD